MSAKVDVFHVPLVSKRLILHLIFGQQLTAFNELMAYTASSCVARLRQIKRMKHCCDKQTLITSDYRTLVTKLGQGFFVTCPYLDATDNEDSPRLC